jgi:hypothetical protein
VPYPGGLLADICEKLFDRGAWNLQDKLRGMVFRLVTYEFLKFNHRALALAKLIHEHLIFPVREHDAMSL